MVVETGGLPRVGGCEVLKVVHASIAVLVVPSPSLSASVLAYIVTAFSSAIPSQSLDALAVCAIKSCNGMSKMCSAFIPHSSS